MKLYKFNKETLEPELVDLRFLWIIPVYLLVGLFIRVFYFSVECCEITDWRGQKAKCTLYEYYNQKK